MILSEYVEVDINKRNKKQLSELGYQVNSDKVNVLIKDLSDNSHFKVMVKCDYCDNEKLLSIKNYNKSIKIGGKYACSQKCSYIKRSEILIEEKGIENIFQSEDIKNKIKKKNKDKWGVEYYTQTNDFKEKTKKTNFQKFGFENPMQSEEVKEKSKNTNQLKWGGTGFESKEILEKIKKSNIKKWGIENPTQINKIKEKIKETNIKKWGGIGFASDIIFNKIKETLKEKYGTDSNTKGEIFRKEHYKLSKDDNYIGYVSDGISLFNCEKGHTYSINKNNYHTRTKSGLNPCTICSPIGESCSVIEKEFIEFVKSIYKNKIIHSYRDGLEIDIYLPDLKIGFEFNGLYWHSDSFKDKKYHLKKTKYFKEKGIRIIHIWEDDWIFKKDIIKSQIRNILNLSKRIFARKCLIKTVDYDETKMFLEENHIQGSYNNFKISIGLYYKSELISIMLFDHFEGRKKMSNNEWNLSRFCNKIGYSVVGGASKLLNYFIRQNNPKRIISYADKSWSEGNLYEMLGFNMINNVDIDYKYIHEKRRTHKSKFRKSRTGISESKLEIPKIWDCGKFKYELVLY